MARSTSDGARPNVDYRKSKLIHADRTERKGASDNSAGVAMTAPKTPEGKWWSCLGDSDEVDEGAAGVAADAAGGVWEEADDEAASAKEAPRALKENP